MVVLKKRGNPLFCIEIHYKCINIHEYSYINIHFPAFCRKNLLKITIFPLKVKNFLPKMVNFGRPPAAGFQILPVLTKFSARIFQFFQILPYPENHILPYAPYAPISVESGQLILLICNPHMQNFPGFSSVRLGIWPRPGHFRIIFHFCPKKIFCARGQE